MLVRVGIIWALYVWLCPVFPWLVAPAATWISSRGLWGRGSLMGQTNSSQCEYLHPEIEKIKSYLTMTGRLGARREATVKYSYAGRELKCMSFSIHSPMCVCLCILYIPPLYFYFVNVPAWKFWHQEGQGNTQVQPFSSLCFDAPSYKNKHLLFSFICPGVS